VADNSSSSGFIIGNWRNPEHDLGKLLEADGRVVEAGSSAAILGHPVRALVAASRMVAKWGETIKPGDIILAGAATAAHHLQPGMTIRNTVQNLGTASFKVSLQVQERKIW
jgi:2-oxo-3-hexenedioate decarboxylase